MDFVREDWTLFRNLDTLAHHAGVFEGDIPPLVAKELVDNALDAGGTCDLSLLETGDGFYVENPGSGFKGNNEDIAQLFSIKRPLMTNKFLRLPTRGRLGNGLRVVSGAVLSMGGTLIVRTAGRSLELTPQDNGTTQVKELGPWSCDTTRIEVTLPKLIRSEVFRWAERALKFKGGTSPLRRSSLLWYDSDSFFELLQAAKETVRELVGRFEGCSGSNATKVAGPFAHRLARGLDRHEAEQLLELGQVGSKPINTERLGPVGREAFPDQLHYHCNDGSFQVQPQKGTATGTIPFLIELWLTPQADKHPQFLVHVNRSPIVESIIYQSSGRQITFRGCGLHVAYPDDAGRYDFWLNIQTPYLPLSSYSKRPNLKVVNESVIKAVHNALKTVKKREPSKPKKKRSIKAFIIENLDRAIQKASGNGRYRYSLRQLFYALRPAYLSEFGNREPNYDTFCQIIIEYENAQGRDLEGIYRDNRGTLYHPHTGERIPLGTLAVEEYRRPEWTFNKILYCEKEGFFPLLIDTKWPERHDCALLTSKGYASKAARDVLDLMAKTEEPLTFFCIHDADGPGTKIYEALQEGTRARPGRAVTIVNLGLEPEEAWEMGLEVETFKRGKKSVPVAGYVSSTAKTWLQSNRVELNAMDTPTFLNWLDRKLETHDGGKVIPPPEILSIRLRDTIQALLKDNIRTKLLQEAGFTEQVRRAEESIEPNILKHVQQLRRHVSELLDEQPLNHWPQPVDQVAQQLVNHFFPKT